MRRWALGLLTEGALTLFFLTVADPAIAAGEFDAAFSGYIARMILALAILGALGYVAVKFLPGYFAAGSRGHIKILGAASLGRDVIYITKTGPEVVAFISGRAGATVLGRWSLEEWGDYEAGAKLTEAQRPDKRTIDES